MFRTANYVDNNCLRCGKTVYPTDKIGKFCQIRILIMIRFI